MDLDVGSIVITEDETRWRVYSITRRGEQQLFVARHLTSPRVLTGGVTNLTWSPTERAWRFRAAKPR